MIVAATGTIAASMYVGTPANLITTAYGKTLLLKIGLFAGVLAYGWMNWRRVRTGEPVREPSLRIEVAFATAVILITSVLTEIEHP